MDFSALSLVIRTERGQSIPLPFDPHVDALEGIGH